MKITPDKVERIIANVQASMVVEGMNPSAEARAIGKQYLEGKISGKEAVAKIKMQHAANFGK
jgi:hypothetical protein